MTRRDAYNNENFRNTLKYFMEISISKGNATHSFCFSGVPEPYSTRGICEICEYAFDKKMCQDSKLTNKQRQEKVQQFLEDSALYG